MNCTITHSRSVEVITTVHDALYEYNLKHTGSPRQDAKPFICDSSEVLFLLGDDAVNYGGVVWHCDREKQKIVVDLFFINDALRGQGYGVKLFNEFESRARTYGLPSISVYTNTFQAPGFYQKMGYTLVKTSSAPLPALPDNCRFFFTKKLED
ncbi:MAG: GNAT family N-acetyltransferase [Lentisphaerae bacterium]|nr:GNAT family N-acetyltransferase [Lentisphaerota bacterium]